MSHKVIRFAINEVEDQALRLEAEKACRRPEQQARWLLRQVLGIADEPHMEPSRNAKNDVSHTRQDSANAVLS
jgi:hypothetical protein